MQINLDISTLFYKLFGYKSEAFDPKFANLPAKMDKFYDGEVFMPVEMQVPDSKIPGQSITYTEALGVTDKYGATTGRWFLPNPVIAARSNKTIIETALTERNGMVSEFINIEGWRFLIKGVLIGQGNEFPEQDFNTLQKLYHLNVPIRMYNGMSDMLLQQTGSDEVKITSLDFAAMPGVKHVRGYIIELTSEVPFNLKDIS